MPIDGSGVLFPAQRLTGWVFAAGVMLAAAVRSCDFVSESTAYVCASFPTTGRP
jgi:hypothetical protein